MVSNDMEWTRPIFFRIKKVIIGMITVKINIGNMLALCISNGVYFGVIRKYATVPPIGIKRGCSK